MCNKQYTPKKNKGNGHVRTCSDLNTSFTHRFIKYYSDVILTVFKYLNLFTPKSIMGDFDYFKGLAPTSIMCL